MRRMNRIVALLLSVLLLVGCLSGIAVSAAGNVELTVKANKTEVKRGEEVTFTVSANGNGNEIGGMEIHVPVDETAFEFVSSELGSAATAAFNVPGVSYKAASKEVVCALARWANGTPGFTESNTQVNGVLFTFKVKAKADAAIGSYSFNMTDGTIVGKNVAGGKTESLPVTKTGATVGIVVPLEGITISDTAITLNKGQTKNLSVSFNPADAGEGRTVTWTSGNTSVATVDADGKVTAVKPGSATITAKCGSFSKTCKVTVKAPLESITLSEAEVTLNKGNTKSLSVTYNPADTTDSKTITWSSDNTDVATVNSYGKITAKAPGTATITAKVGDKTATCKVTVVVPMTGISLNKTSITMGKNDTLQLEVTYKPADTTDNKTVVWTSDNEAVASVDANGKVTTGTTGKAVITAKVGSYTAKCTITVEAIITDFTLSHSAHTMDKGDTVQLSVSNIIPDDTHQSKNVTWTSSNSGVAKVDSTGKVTAVSGGKATITAKVGNVKKTCEITVNLPLTKIELNAGILDMTKGDTYQLKVSYTPSNTTDDKTVTWSVYNPDIASVDENGKITALKEGATVVFAHVGELTAICEVHVTEVHLESVNLNKEALDLKVSKTATLSYTLNPDADEITDELGEAVWTSDNEAVAKVENGKITGISAGSAVITVTVNDKSAQCVVTVTDIEITDLKISADGKQIKNTYKIKPETSAQLTVDFLPADFTVEPGEVTFASSDEAVFTVDAEGKINAIALGEAELTVTCGTIVKKIPVIVTLAVTPETGDNTLTGAFVLLAVLSLMGVAATGLYIFRRRYSK